MTREQIVTELLNEAKTVKEYGEARKKVQALGFHPDQLAHTKPKEWVEVVETLILSKREMP